jgi:hypothetical protein
LIHLQSLLFNGPAAYIIEVFALSTQLASWALLSIVVHNDILKMVARFHCLLSFLSAHDGRWFAPHLSIGQSQMATNY